MQESSSILSNVLQEEAELLRGCVANERAAQSKLYKKYERKMMSVCLRYSKNREEAEDTLTEGFMRVFEKLNTFKSAGSLEGWIRRVIVNVAIEKYRRNRDHGVSLISVDSENTHIQISGSTDIVGNLNVKELMNLIQKLPPVYQMVFNLYVFEGLSHKEIAEQLNISEGTSKSNLYDAREWLKKRVTSITIERNIAS
ncbi:MAG: RNA polymerase sigma factor [Bacteroidia bacterium]